MAYKKIILAVNCENEAEQQKVQEIAKELSGILQLQAKNLIELYPTLQKNKGLLFSVVNTISKEGKKGLFKLVPMLLRHI